MQKQIKLIRRPAGMPVMEDFEFAEAPIEEPGTDEVLVRTVYISVDPYLRGRMNDVKSYIPPFKLNEPIVSSIIGQVVKSQSSRFSEGDVVIGMLPWKEFNTVKEKKLRTIDTTIAPAPAYLSVLGTTGLTAYFGLLDIGKPQPGETVVVSGAAGAVGSVAGQIAKIKGARVVGIAGSIEKVEFLTRKLKFDEAINYKTEDVAQALAAACPNGIDVYFENVGGEISDAVFPLLNKFSRIPVCGAISGYNKQDADIGPRVQSYLIKSSALMQGFTVGNYADRYEEGIRALANWLQEGQLKYEVTITNGFDRTIEAFLDLFSGANLGKALVKVSAIEKE